MTNRYKVYCPTTQSYYYTYSDTPPETNPNNSSLQVDPNRTQLIHSFNIGKFYMYEGKTISIPPQSEFTYDYVFDQDVRIMGMVVYTEDVHKGDEIDFILNPDTIIGTLTQDTTQGSNTYNVSESVVSNVQKGMYISTPEDCFGKIINIDVLNQRITTDSNCTGTCIAGTPLKIRQYFVKSYPLNTNGKHSIGYSPSEKFFPAGTRLRLVYKNYLSIGKNLLLAFEYEY